MRKLSWLEGAQKRKQQLQTMDGTADYYEDNMVMFNGVTLKLDKNSPDTDNDGVLDGKEVCELKYEYNVDKTKVIVTGKVNSNPLVKDIDDDISEIALGVQEVTYNGQKKKIWESL